MNRKIVRLIALGSFALVAMLSALTWADDSKTQYLSMAPLDQYLMAD